MAYVYINDFAVYKTSSKKTTRDGLIKYDTIMISGFYAIHAPCKWRNRVQIRQKQIIPIMSQPFY